jgi:hypothetical protein
MKLLPRAQRRCDLFRKFRLNLYHRPINEHRLRASPLNPFTAHYYDNNPLSRHAPLYDCGYLQIDTVIAAEHNSPYGFGHIFLLFVAWNSVSCRLFT